MPLPPFVIPRFDPRRIPGLESWWDAADAASVTLDAGRVSQLADKSGKGRHAANTTSGSTQPTYVTGARNGLNVARFAAASVQRLTVASSTGAYNFLHDGTDSFIVAVCSYGTASDPNAVYGLLGNNAGGTANVGLFVAYEDRTTAAASDALRVDITAGTLGQSVANGLNAGNTATLSGTNNLVPAQTFVVQEIAVDANNATASQRVRIRSNGGTEVAENNKSLSPSTAGATFNLQIGAIGNNGLPLQGDICEILMFSQIPTAAARDLIRRYLASKWGIALA
jgi:hypothetical protein